MNIGMNNLIAPYLNDLRLISKMKIGQSLLINNSSISIYEFGWYNWLLRKWYNVNKQEVIRYIATLFRNIGDIVDNLKEEAKYRDTINNIYEQVEKSLVGIHNLSITYKNYPELQVKIESLVEDQILPVMKKINTLAGVNRKIKYGERVMSSEDTQA